MEQRFKDVRTVKRDMVMCHRWTDSAKEFVWTGYRPDGCNSLVVALFHYHNETFNIWSHIVGVVVVVWYGFQPQTSNCSQLTHALNAHVFCGVLCAASSTLYHIGECISREWYTRLLKLDMACAFSCCVAHSVLIISFELLHVDPRCAAILLSVAALVTPVGLYLFLFADVSSYPFISASLYATPLLLIGAAWIGAFHTARHWFLLKWSVMFLMTSVIWLGKLPERYVHPGTLDFVGNSHNIMHLLVIVLWATLYSEYGVSHAP